MNAAFSRELLLIVVCTILLVSHPGGSLAQESILKLPTSDDTSSFNVTDSHDAPVMEVGGDGNVDVGGTVTAETFAGDGSNLDNVRPIAAYAGGDLRFTLTVAQQVVKYVEISVPSKGIIIVNATGYTAWKSAGKDAFRASITTGTTFDYANSCFGTDFGSDTLNSFTPFAISRGYTVNSGGTYRYNLVGENLRGYSGFENSDVVLGDVVITAMYFPTGGVAASKPAIPGIMEEEAEQVAPGPGIDTPDL